MGATTSIQVKRSRLAGMVLRPLGQPYWGVKQTGAGFNFLGKNGKCVAFSELAGPPKATRVLGFQAASFPLKKGDAIEIAGLKGSAVAQLVASAQSALSRYYAAVVAGVEDELQSLAKAVVRLENPRRYPAACLLGPFLDRVQALLEKFPDGIPDDALPEDRKRLLDAIGRFARAPHRMREDAIERFVETELEEMKDFFDSVESNPLTAEQRLAVVTDEDASLVLAGAGSGKTSVIVAKAAYLIGRGIREPKEILLMAFGKDAAAEMAERVKERSGASVDALTFHALGYKIIGQVEGAAPALAAHASDDAQFRALLRDILIDDVGRLGGLNALLIEWFSEFHRPFKSEWDFKTKSEYDRYISSQEFRTLGGELVKSFEELQIANWLYSNGIAYEYEPAYEHKLPENDRRTYRPDFRLSESGLYIEHFGVRKAKGPQGEPRLVTAPYVDRERYLEGMAWKRRVHRDKGTILIETFSYEQVEGRLTEALAEKIAPYVTCKPLSQDRIFDRLKEMGRVDPFTQTLATFLRHFKSSGASIAQCRERSETAADASRSRAFLKIFEPLIEAYRKHLEDRIDFEDMIARAAEYVEAGRYKSPYRHLIVDEFQDSSEGRARLLQALKAQHDDARLFAVGDDWQSIYRFAGSDIHLMRDFGREFGGRYAEKKDVHRTVDLGRTFRSVDKIALPARRFVLQNPSQIDKKVAAASTTDKPAIEVRYYEGRQHDAVLKGTLDDLAQGSTKRISVLLLGRYHFLKPKNLGVLNGSHAKVSARFMTVHASKGLEADHVVILRAESGPTGFPSGIADDPLLELVLPKPEKFEHAEERRLFYVALTRARQSVTILADRKKPSAFVRELIDDPAYEVLQVGNAAMAEHRCGRCGGRMLAQTTEKGRTLYSCEYERRCGETLDPCTLCSQDLPRKDPSDPERLICSCGALFPVCPECNGGWLVERRGKYGTFLGCVRYPRCKAQRRLPKTGRLGQR
ncbi:MAG: UvrD-helicase domain-containing protein [Rhodospirillales bacterium]|nr:UvrD-helicase domain-containing protein [Rhodospirillales bacterium]